MTRQPDHPIDAQFLNRRSPRVFSADTVTPAQMLSLLEAARWAPSASNNQPWRAVWGLRGDEAHSAIAASLVPGNRTWAGQAGGLIAWAACQTVQREGVARANPWANFDAGTAWGYLALQAQAMGLITHAMGGFDAAALAAALDMPAHYSLMAVIAVGHLGDINALPEAERAREAPNGRNPVPDWAAQGRFI